jgi:4-amino-4-deoxy-L-arabinose transferase-like glycosyltransferase
VFGGIALACVVAIPATLATVLVWRQHRRAREALAVTGLLLVGWILVEVLVVRVFSPLQPVCLVAGAGLILLGDRQFLRRIDEAVTGLPLFLAAPLVRPWHLRWGATREEVAGAMPGDDLVTVAHFTATRAITIDAPPEQVWPWIVQVGYRRAGFYSYDLLDNLGRPSADTILPVWQHPRIGNLAAPMASPPTDQTSFRISRLKPPVSLVWAKLDSSWAWELTPLPGARTRLVTRLKQRYRPVPSALITVVLAEVGDFAMMRKMLLGIKSRAETGSVTGGGFR